jgi:tRNA (uracil-5-)-methyltransferase TRM9
MRQEMIDRLLALNKEFYQSFADSFSETRGRVQPGVLVATQTLPKDASVLDVGCGNGGLARKLKELGHLGPYFGLDSSAELLTFAKENNIHPKAQYLRRDISDPGWTMDLPGSFDRIFCFASLHHIPGQDLRSRIFETFFALLKPSGRLVFSVWNFLVSPRLRKRIVPWESVQIDPQELDPEDYLLDWRRGGYGVRYVHAFRTDELEGIARETGFKVLDTYYSDGEGGNLGFYHVWQPAQKPDL